MDVILMNPTEDPIEAMHASKWYIFKPGEKKMLPGPAANLILSKFAMRGIIQLNFGDDTNPDKDQPSKTIMEVKAERGREVFREFMLKQVNTYNQDNIAREHKKDPGVEPTATVKKYAERLGAKLITTYFERDDKQNAINQAAEENKSLRSMIERQDAMIEKQSKMLQELAAKISPNEEVKIPTELPTEQEMKEQEILQSFMIKNKNQLKKFIEESRPEIGAWPENIKSKLRERFATLTGENLTGI